MAAIFEQPAQYVCEGVYFFFVVYPACHFNLLWRKRDFRKLVKCVQRQRKFSLIFASKNVDLSIGIINLLNIWEVSSSLHPHWLRP